ncbi:hypothetical protein EJ110_NYTH54686 [Nymphaea thermarum]|nr:hypothetical protein EJ110_NYTH54686 [Nymphaea thermarum]
MGGIAGYVGSILHAGYSPLNESAPPPPGIFPPIHLRQGLVYLPLNWGLVPLQYALGPPLTDLHSCLYLYLSDGVQVTKGSVDKTEGMYERWIPQSSLHQLMTLQISKYAGNDPSNLLILFSLGNSTLIFVVGLLDCDFKAEKKRSRASGN